MKKNAIRVRGASKVRGFELKNEMNEILVELVKNMKPTEHVILLYSNSKEKHDILFTYLKAGLEMGEAAAYVAGEQSPEEVRRAMREFGIDVGRYSNIRRLVL